MIYALAPSLGSLSLYHCNDQFQKDGGEESPTRCNKHMGKNEIQRSYSNQFQPFKRIVFSVSQANDLALKSIRDLPQANSQLAYHTAVTSSNLLLGNLRNYDGDAETRSIKKWVYTLPTNLAVP